MRFGKRVQVRRQLQAFSREQFAIIVIEAALDRALIETNPSNGVCTMLRVPRHIQGPSLGCVSRVKGVKQLGFRPWIKPQKYTSGLSIIPFRFSTPDLRDMYSNTAPIDPY